jgi:predicted small secreted protein
MAMTAARTSWTRPISARRPRGAPRRNAEPAPARFLNAPFIVGSICLHCRKICVLGTEQSPVRRVGEVNKETLIMRIPTVFLLLSLLAACETVQGFGRDVETGGAVLQEQAEEVQEGG